MNIAKAQDKLQEHELEYIIINTQYNMCELLNNAIMNNNINKLLFLVFEQLINLEIININIYKYFIIKKEVKKIKNQNDFYNLIKRIK